MYKIILFAILFFNFFMASAKDFVGKLSASAASSKLATLEINAKRVTTSFGEFLVIEDTVLSGLIKNKLSDDLFEYIEPNYSYHVDVNDTLPVLDPMFSRQWGLRNTGKNVEQSLLRGKKGMDIDALRAWTITTGKKSVKIAIIDTGVDYTHPDLLSNMWVNEEEKNGLMGVDDDENGYIDDIHGYNFVNNSGDPQDDYGHGTHCAGVIGASHDTIGISGVMAQVSLVAIKFLNQEGVGSLENALKSIQYAIDIGADIMSNSWGGFDESAALAEAIRAAETAGIVFVVAAGNSMSNNDKKPVWPSNYAMSNVISVGAMNGQGGRSYFSNFGEKSVHIFAPGSNILSTYKTGGYYLSSGTSMATPFVAGMVGLLLSHQAKLNPQEVRDRLIDTAEKSFKLDKSVAGGRANAYRLLSDTR